MSTVMDKETKKIMDECERLGFFKASSKEEVQKFVDKGGMDNQVLIDGAYHYKDDIDGSRFRKHNRISLVFWCGLLVGAIVLATLIWIGVIPE